jgi:hypothetical protein
MIDGKFLVSKGHAAWRRKSDAVLAFKNSIYWEDIVEALYDKHPDMVHEGYRSRRWWNEGQKGKELEDAKYTELLESGRVKYYEIEPVPSWV